MISVPFYIVPVPQLSLVGQSPWHFGGDLSLGQRALSKGTDFSGADTVGLYDTASEAEPQPRLGLVIPGQEGKLLPSILGSSD